MRIRMSVVYVRVAGCVRTPHPMDNTRTEPHLGLNEILSGSPELSPKS